MASHHIRGDTATAQLGVDPQAQGGMDRLQHLGGKGSSGGPEETVRLEPGAKYIVSIGSVGQPRDGDPRACFGLLDDEARTITYHRVPYDIERTAGKIREAGLSEHFARRLAAGV